jgi:D-alanine transaminase
MSRYAYVNGRYVAMRDAMVHVEDRGYQFADGVYEVCEVKAGRLIDARRHLDRLERSLAALRIRMPMSRAALDIVLREVAARNRIGYGLVYLQITRGVARRDHAFPSPEVTPTVVVTARPLNRTRNEAAASTGISVISVPDNRWGRVDIKTVGLLPNVLARQAAIEQGARDAWFVDNSGTVTEAASANTWIVTRDRRLVTRRADPPFSAASPAPWRSTSSRRKGFRSRNGLSPWRRPTRRAKRSLPRRPRSCFRSSGSTAAASATAPRDQLPWPCAENFISTPKSARFDRPRGRCGNDPGHEHDQGRARIRENR